MLTATKKSLSCKVTNSGTLSTHQDEQRNSTAILAKEVVKNKNKNKIIIIIIVSDLNGFTYP